jgi:hypothetical protein
MRSHKSVGTPKDFTRKLKTILDKIIFIFKLAGPSGAARDYFTISLWKSPVQNDLRTLRALGWGEPPTNKIFIHKPTLRSNFCLLTPAQFSKHTPPFGRVDPGGPGSGWAPSNKKILYKPIPRRNFCLLAPAQFYKFEILFWYIAWIKDFFLFILYKILGSNYGFK